MQTCESYGLHQSAPTEGREGVYDECQPSTKYTTDVYELNT